MTSPVANDSGPDLAVGATVEWSDFDMSDAVWLLQRELDAEVIHEAD